VGRRLRSSRDCVWNAKTVGRLISVTTDLSLKVILGPFVPVEVNDIPAAIVPLGASRVSSLKFALGVTRS
jgi:hypothetical protein